MNCKKSSILALSVACCLSFFALPFGSAQEASSPGTGAPAAVSAPAALPQSPLPTTPSISAPNSHTLSDLLQSQQRRGKANSTDHKEVVASPITALSEFEMFADQAAGHPLHVYGRQLFDQVPTTFAPMDRIPVPADYVIGPGDEVIIKVWGKVNLDTTATVDRNGQIFVPKVGVLTVAGLRFDQLESFLQTAIGNLYKGFELNVTMGQLRSIQIFALGSVRKPGVYTVSSLSTLVNAIFACGGPSSTGSMRHIELRRGGRLVTEMDIYDLLRHGNKSKDAPLLPGDVIYIPPVGPQIAIMGSVNDPGIYELKGPTDIASALKDAAGLTTLAERSRAVLERIVDHRRRQIDAFPLNAASLARPMRDGDMLQVFPISPQFDNAVILRGNVAQPGRFPWHSGMRISDLIPSRRFLITSSYWDQQNNAANHPSTDVLSDVGHNNVEINWQYASIERLDPRDLSTHLIPFNLANAIDNPGSADDHVLLEGDVITVFSRRDLPLPIDKHAAFVRVSGEVNAPGVYRIAPGETLRQLVEQAGGLTPHSYLYASQLTRVSTQQIEEQELQLSINQMRRDLLSKYAAPVSLNPASAAEQQAQLSAQEAMIQQIESFKPTGRIVLEMNSRAASTTDVPDFPLEDGDAFYIPPRMATIQVSGAVYNANAFRYKPGKRLSAYLKNAGGPTRQANTKDIFLVRADGTVVSRRGHDSFWGDSFEDLRLLPGDAIVVPTKMKSQNAFVSQIPFLAQILSQSAMAGSMVALTY